MTEINTDKTMDALRKEFRVKLIGAIVAAIIGGFGSALITLWSYAQSIPTSIGLVPVNAVMAFDTRDGCPSPGWRNFDKALGRTIVGADFPNWSGARHLDEKNRTLSPRKPDDVGGEEIHLLTAEELPSHTHEITLPKKWGTKAGADAGGWGNGEAPNGDATFSTKPPAGGNKPHNNMPPFIALIFCKRVN